MIFGLSLSNDYLSSFQIDRPLIYQNIEFISVVQAYEYLKCAKAEDALHILELKSYDAHKFGQTVVRMPEWSKNKFTVLGNILYTRFSDPDLKERLLGTTCEYIMCTSANDKFGYWDYNLYKKHNSCTEDNYYGKMLMVIRFLLQTGKTVPPFTRQLVDVISKQTCHSKDIERVESKCREFYL